METTGAIRRRAVHFEDQHSDSGSGLSLVDAPLLPVGSAKSHHGGRGKQHPPTPFSSTFNNSTFLSSEGEEGTPSSAQGGWKIGSSPASKAEHISGGSAAADAALLYSPASTSLLASVKKVDDLRARLEQLEATLRDMESRAVEQLDAQLQEKVLATAIKLVQQRCLVEGAIDRQVQEELLQTARKVVERKAEESLAAAAAAASDTGSDALARRLAFEGGEGDAAASLPAEQLLEQFAAHVESGLGESMRRLERKADMVAGLLDQGAIDLLESQLTSGLASLEGRLAAVETRDDQASAVAARVASLEEAVREQQRAVLDLVAALRGGRGAGPAVVPVQAAAVAAAGGGMPCAGGAPAPVPPPPEPKPAAPRGPLPKLKALHGPSAAQTAALASARVQLARSREAAAEAAAAEEETPLLLSLLYAVGWVAIILLGAASLGIGALAAAIKNGVVEPADWGLPL